MQVKFIESTACLCLIFSLYSWSKIITGIKKNLMYSHWPIH